MTARWLWTNLYKNNLFSEELIETTKDTLVTTLGFTSCRGYCSSYLLGSNQIRKNICQCSLIKDKQGHQYTPREFYQQFHKVWGQLMKTGYQSSCLAHQVSFL
ncbi:hypothetical protein C4D60_Mb02t17890 [Musa balbisiana]|uniref:Uncharacterized protein n=1 Tax=Musa balbisiana TaxID=52838 RepID=A0A4S8IBH6_MUSBA|nr:hypothetical protein C4D60_Mb02t17890 [Musa balbisiana]